MRGGFMFTVFVSIDDVLELALEHLWLRNAPP